MATAGKSYSKRGSGRAYSSGLQAPRLGRGAQRCQIPGLSQRSSSQLRLAGSNEGMLGSEMHLTMMGHLSEPESTLKTPRRQNK